MKTLNFLLAELRACRVRRYPAARSATCRSDIERLVAHMPDLRLTLLVGTYALTDAFEPGKMTERVIGFRDHLPAIFPLPHPSWRSRHWAAKNPWFDAKVLPALCDAVRRALV